MLFSAFILGLIGSIHCAVMCGPIAFMLPLDHQHPVRKIKQIFLYHAGRITAYAIIGLLVGVLGKSLNLMGLQQGLSILVGGLMVLFVVLPQRLLAKYNGSKPIYRVLSRLKSAMGKAFKKKSSDTFLTIGFLNGFLPCGMLYMAAFTALASGSVLGSISYLVLFGMGTIPLMTTVVFAGNFVSVKVRQYLQRVIPVVVVLMGLWFIVRGLGFGIPYLSPASSVTAEVTSSYDCHF